MVRATVIAIIAGLVFAAAVTVGIGAGCDLFLVWLERPYVAYAVALGLATLIIADGVRMWRTKPKKSR